MAVETPLAALPPVRPIVAVICVVFHNASVLLARRANPPDAGMWGFPGGKIEAGETIEDAALRELHEETGLRASVLQVFGAVDAFDRDDSGHLLQHFVLVTVLCEWLSGEPVAGDDAIEVRWFTMDDLESSDIALSLDVAEVAHRGAALAERCHNWA